MLSSVHVHIHVISTVETYEHSMKGGLGPADEREENETRSQKLGGYRYLPAHPKSATHLQ